jgi:glycine/D-amino acid oxidase-like deaminating enzyme
VPANATNVDEAKDLQTDLCIIGGGIIGASMAWFAKEAGIKAILLDAR